MNLVSNEHKFLMPVFDDLDFWKDDDARTGAENMAVDQLLMERVGRRPLLRFYQWCEPTVTFGYFLALDDARDAFPESSDSPLTYIRRWTGGGIVDHRTDFTYTLVIPRTHALSMQRGAESYRVIHQALADTLKKLGEQVRVTAVGGGDGGLACFTNPVAYDLTNSKGEKVAGAGQRRCRYGLLHQGSLVTEVSIDLLGSEFASCLAVNVDQWEPDKSFYQDVSNLAGHRYATDVWLSKK